MRPDEVVVQADVIAIEREPRPPREILYANLTSPNQRLPAVLGEMLGYFGPSPSETLCRTLWAAAGVEPVELSGQTRADRTHGTKAGAGGYGVDLDGAGGDPMQYTQHNTTQHNTHTTQTHSAGALPSGHTQMDDFLGVLATENMTAGFVFFDDCWQHSGANLSTTCVPLVGVHNGVGSKNCPRKL